MHITDLTLLEKWTRESDAEAFQEIASRYAAMVYATCRRVLGNDTEAEDVTQECFEILAEKSLEPKVHLGAWLHAVATNRSLNRITADKRRKDREARFAGEHRTSDETEWSDIYQYVDEAVAELPDKLRAPLVAHFFEHKSHGAIARTLGTSRQTVTYRIGKGIERIRKALRKRGIPVAVPALSARKPRRRRCLTPWVNWRSAGQEVPSLRV